MFTLSSPSEERLRSIIELQKDAPFSYPEVGATFHSPLPSGYSVDRNRLRLGAGRAFYAAAKLAIERWKMFDRRWLRVFPENAAIREGAMVGVVAAHLGFYSVNLCRIVYVVNTESTFGFAYGTLPEHAAAGEERFTVSREEDGSVWFDILAMSKPRAVLANVGYPVGRAMQRRFALTAMASMTKAVAEQRPQEL